MTFDSLKNAGQTALNIAKWPWTPLEKDTPSSGFDFSLGLDSLMNNVAKIALRAIIVTATVAIPAIALAILFGTIGAPVAAIIAGTVASAAILVIGLAAAAATIAGLAYIALISTLALRWV